MICKMIPHMRGGGEGKEAQRGMMTVQIEHLVHFEGHFGIIDCDRSESSTLIFTHNNVVDALEHCH